MKNEALAITLEDILAAKEERQKRQEAMQNKYKTALLSITINIPGRIKDTPVIRELLEYAVKEVRRAVSVQAIELVFKKTGPEAIISADAGAEELKQKMIVLEEEKPFGRLIDIDVFSAGGELISRNMQGNYRKCFVCSENAVLCMRESRHEPQEVRQAADKLLMQFSAYLSDNVNDKAKKLGELAVEAMLFEAACTPAPGLVDRANSGAHADMDFYAFMSSTAALTHTLARCAQAGYNHAAAPAGLLSVLRIIGTEGERQMLKATGGVNTHKGLLFSLGIAAAAAGFLIGRQHKINFAEILAAVKAIAKDIVREFESIKDKPPNELTAGERLYKQYGITGIRGEIAAGLPAINSVGLPVLKKALKTLSVNDALVETLLHLISVVEDTTVMNRHNPEKLRSWVNKKVRKAITAGGMYSVEGRKLVQELDQEFILHNVSPGGAADLLAVTWFIYRICTKSSELE